MTLAVYMKRPADQLDYGVDFSRWLPAGDTIIGAVPQVVPVESGVSAIILPQHIGPDSVTVWASGGESGKTATIIVTATTAQNRVKQVEFQIRVRD